MVEELRTISLKEPKKFGYHPLKGRGSGSIPDGSTKRGNCSLNGRARIHFQLRHMFFYGSIVKSGL